MNPFQPSFGKNPPQLIGRQAVIDDFAEGLDQGVGDERRATLYTGLRGMGKTVVLNQISARARDKGWIVAEVSASQTMLGDILDQVIEQTQQIVPFSKRDITGFNFSIFGIGAGVAGTIKTQETYGWRMQMSKMLDELAKKGIGVLVTIDEAHSGSPELRDFASAYQHFVREDRKVAVALAGLPFEVSDILNDKVLTFLRRANKVVLRNVDIEDVGMGLLKTIEDNGRTIGADALRTAAKATVGYPYLIQLVGSRIWGIHDGYKEITLNDVAIGIPLATAKLFDNVVDPMVKELSPKDLEVLRAMSVDEGPSSTGVLAKRLDVDTNYLSQYRRRLMDSGLIYSPTRGMVDYTIPFMQEYFAKDAQQH